MQIVVPASQRIEFSGIEMVFVSAAEVAQRAVTAIWARPEQFGSTPLLARDQIAKTQLSQPAPAL